MNDLHKAYIVLGLEPGASIDSVMRRYKRLIMVWHPDRAPTKEHKEFAEQELKKINAAKDTLSKHFAEGGGHRSEGCECQNSQRAHHTHASPGPGYHRNKSDDARYEEEQTARRRDYERRTQDESYGSKSAPADEDETFENAIQHERKMQDEKLRWRVSLGLVVAFVALEMFGALAIGIKGGLRDFFQQWQKPPSSSIQTPASISSTANPPSNLPPDYDTSKGDRSNWQAEQAQRNEEKKKQIEEKRNRDLSLTKVEIDKYEKVIQHCNNELSTIAEKLDDPNISEVEKQKLVQTREFQEKNLRDAEESLVYYRKTDAAIDVSDVAPRTSDQSPVDAPP